jgi:Icc-related predicted phosphoesterase
MKAWILSDLHCDHGTVPPLVPPEADIAIIAGDVMNDEWLLEVAQRLPVVFVVGNHEFYKRVVAERLKELDDLVYRSDYAISFLENDWSLLQNGTTIAGATLWTDYNNGDPVAMEKARQGLNDHRMIRDFQPSDALALHHDSLVYLRNSRSDVIVTHHAPHRNSVHSRYTGQLLNYAFFSDVLETFDKPPKLWIHGHVHDCFDYTVGETRVICNPHGYPGENAAFDPALIVEI